MKNVMWVREWQRYGQGGGRLCYQTLDPGRGRVVRVIARLHGHALHPLPLTHIFSPFIFIGIVYALCQYKVVCLYGVVIVWYDGIVMV